jgi:Methyl-accepting chemotaxis protein
MRRKMKLGTRLIVSFGIVALAGIGISVFGFTSIIRINEADRRLYEKMTAPIGSLVKMTEDFQLWRINLRDYLDAPTKEAAAAALDAARSRSADLGTKAAEFEKELTTDDGRKLYADFSKANAAYGELFERLVQLHAAGKDAEVSALMSGQGKIVTAAEQQAVDSLADAKISLAGDIAKENSRLSELTMRIMEVEIVALVLLALLISILITRSITKSVGGEPERMAELADQVALGDLDAVLGDRNKSTGIQRSLAVMVDSFKAKSESLKLIAEGDLTEEVQLASERDAVGISLRAMLGSLNELLAQISGAVEQIAAGSSQVSSASEELSQGAAEQAASVEEICASLSELSSQTEQNSESARAMSELAKAAREEADKGNGGMVELAAAMADINKSSDDIKKVVKAIDDIAFQINLLALNANVEAARAGKYGKGFAVVADEVRSLAARSAEAVKETTRMVEDSIAKMAKGDELAHRASAQLAQIAESSARAASLADEVAIASAEQSRGLEQINSGVSQIDQVTQANSSSAEECAATAEELAAQAQQLKSLAERFRLRPADDGPRSNAGALSPELLERVLAELKARGIALAPGAKAAGSLPKRESKAAIKGGSRLAIKAASEAGSETVDDEDFREF